ncbi:MAG: SsrA-binding protein SmpB [Anaerorhabdus sp.]|uniref:SsrA-binding protein SmpB n=1 Tax=Anaerorhabdus sp. TaxID=1872524 RepID=UPI002B1FC343|nr:SsrA-binding protein SmpB [Anaerorhabdus sp.]MEA4875760.1 SsrA-binding protein SmpB [Anaerorhabdus sp.]
MFVSEKIVSLNRSASHEYFLEDRYEAGLVLTGTEIKSIRQGKVQFKDAYISFNEGEAFIKEMHIAQYDHGTHFNHDETRERKLLLHRDEIRKLNNKVKLKGYTVVPTKMYLKNGRAKVEIALAKGKALYDKRQDDKIKTAKREMEKALKLR